MKSAPRAVGKTGGFTLIELLVSSVLLMGMIALASLSFNWFSTQWQRQLSDIEQHYQSYIEQQQFSAALQGIVPYMVNKQTSFGFYFLGRDTGFTAMTLSPIFQPGAPAIIRVFAEQDGDKHLLVYEEASIRGIFLISADQVLPFSHRIVLRRLPEAPKFSYLIKERAAKPNSLVPDIVDSVMVDTWLPGIDGIETQKHPVRVAIQLGDLKLQYEIASRTEVTNSRATSGDAI